ncbi:MAG: TIGR02147 family protein [Deltaproteobacteria bacterium]|nr:TIGR02147 family protein [Deltaproteobacteria bacterium]
MKGKINQHQFQRLLQTALSSAKNKNTRYSLRAFSKRIGLTPSAVSEIIRGKRAVSTKLANRVIERLRDENQSRFIENIFNNETSHLPLKYQILKADEFALISSWQHFAILSLLEVERLKGIPRKIATSLHISEGEVLRSLERLQRLGLAEKISKLQWKATGKSYHSSDGISDESILRSHFESLELAQKSLENHPLQARDFTSLTFRMNPKNLNRIRQLVRDFREKICKIAETKEAEEVFKLCIQIFPLNFSTEKKAAQK